MLQTIVDEVLPQLIVALRDAEVDGLVNVVCVLQQQRQRLLPVAHPPKHKHHLWVQLPLLAELQGCLQAIVIALSQEVEQLWVIHVCIQLHLQLMEVRTRPRILLKKRIQVHVLKSTLVVELRHDVRYGDLFCAVDKQLDGLVLVELHQSKHLVTHRVVQPVVHDQLEYVLPLQLEVDLQRLVVVPRVQIQLRQHLEQHPLLLLLELPLDRLNDCGDRIHRRRPLHHHFQQQRLVRLQEV
mmetsp:Transcript_26181/g.64657  ORF Transcript_26181/g.64657 Transcript_26181/m.64657 type:complete len:240 (-) Transcript_26181:1542-2261(-)